MDFSRETKGTEIGDQDLQRDSVLHCLFCKHGQFSCKDGLGSHVRVQYLQRQTANEGFFCPSKGCPYFMGIPVYFLSHAARQHQVFL